MVRGGGSDGLQVLSALDAAKTQWYHFTAIVVAGMGFFTDAYDLFCISLVTKLLGRIYYTDTTQPDPGSLPPNVATAVNGVAFCGTLSGQLFFGWLGDKLGRKSVYGMTLMLMVMLLDAGTEAMGASASASASASVATQLNLPPGYRFVPKDEELVGEYLVPRLLGNTLPPNEILDVDPLSAPPAQLLTAHGSQDAFFFAEAQAKHSRGSRQKRTCAGGGAWQGQTTLVEDKRLRVPGMGTHDVQWCKKSFNFHEDKSGSTGWVMHEYAVTAPPKLAELPLRLYRIRCSGHGKNAKKRKRGGQDSNSDDDDAAAHARANTQQTDVAEGSAAPFVGEYHYPSAAQSAEPDATDGRAGQETEDNVQNYMSNLTNSMPLDIPEIYTGDDRIQDILEIYTGDDWIQRLNFTGHFEMSGRY